MEASLAATDRRTVLLTLGRLPVVLDIARSFKRLGWRVLVAEPTRMHLARMSKSVDRCFGLASPVTDRARYLDGLAAIIERECVDLVVPVSEESMHVAALTERLAESVDVFGMPQPDMLALHDKYRFARSAGDLGLRIPQTELPATAAGEALVASMDFVVKPRYSCSGRGVTFHTAGDSSVGEPGTLVQARIAGDACSLFAIARDGRVVASAAYRGTVMDGSVAVGFERLDDTAALDDWARSFVADRCHTGFIAFDFVIDDRGDAWAIECNPRATSGIHFIDVAALATAILGSEPVAPTHRPDRFLVESYSCFTATLGALFTRGPFRDNWRQLRRSRDVTWSASDPWPFLLMMVNTYRIVGLSMFGGHTFAAAAMLDIEWREADAG